MHKSGLISRIGFTLAEVLITLAIIGIVAALTIPSLITSIQDQQYKTAWKKNYSVLEQVSRQLIDESGNLYGYFYQDFNGAEGSNNTLITAFKNKLNVVKTCYTGEVSGSCWSISTNDLNGTLSTLYPTKALVLADGTFIGFGPQSGVSYNNIEVDVNGFKGPNTYGKDIFSTFLTTTSLFPCGSASDTTGKSALVEYSMSSCVTGSTAWWNTGFGCSAKKLLE